MLEAIGRVGNGASSPLTEDWGLSILVLRTAFSRIGGTSLGCNTVPASSRMEGFCLSWVLEVTCKWNYYFY